MIVSFRNLSMFCLTDSISCLSTWAITKYDEMYVIIMFLYATKIAYIKQIL